MISEWVTEPERPVAWLSLDGGDNDPTRFLTYLIAALQTVAPQVGAGLTNALSSPQPPSTEAVMTSLLNELAFVPVDYREGAPADEWSGDRGCGVQYFSQQAVGRLLGPAGMEVDPGLALPERLVHLQELMAAGDPRAQPVYETIGSYLGYALLDYRDWYDVEHLLLLGRVMTGAGGDVVIERARAVLAAENPAAAEAITIHVPSERDRRHGQAHQSQLPDRLVPQRLREPLGTAAGESLDVPCRPAIQSDQQPQHTEQNECRQQRDAD
mgnify:CR=1 FL=1